MLGIVPVLAAVAALHTVDVPAQLGDARIEKARDRSGLTVLLPDSFRASEGPLYPAVSAAEGRYALYLGLSRACRGGGACGLAAFTGEAGGRLFGRRRVRLHDGIVGRYQRPSCGASCSGPAIGWRAGGTTYTISFKFLPGGHERRAITRIADQAIDAGAR